MKKLISLLSLFFLIGCTSEQIKTMATDPHYAQYQDKRDGLEKSYLDGSLNYVDYQKQVQQLDENYTKEVKERENIIHEHRN